MTCDALHENRTGAYGSDDFSKIFGFAASRKWQQPNAMDLTKIVNPDVTVIVKL